jgi:hypothetical protein
MPFVNKPPRNTSGRIMENVLIRAIKDYQAVVSEIQQLFLKKFGTKEPLRSWGHQQIPKEGYLDSSKNYHYSFHGVGCKVIIRGTEIVDFDYGVGFRYDGFDPGRIWMFIKDKMDKYPDLDSLEKIKGLFEQFIDQGILVYPPQIQLGRIILFQK